MAATGLPRPRGDIIRRSVIALIRRVLRHLILRRTVTRRQVPAGVPKGGTFGAGVRNGNELPGGARPAGAGPPRFVPVCVWRLRCTLPETLDQSAGARVGRRMPSFIPHPENPDMKRIRG